MATKEQVNNFINMIAPIAQNLCRTREKWILPSVCIAQACCESAYGTSKAMAGANGLFGFKVGRGVRYGNAWKGKSYNTKTKEFYGQYVSIRDNFRAYDTVEEAVEDYMDLLCGLSRYNAAVCETDPKKCITAIKNGGYATSPTYINTIMSIISRYNLTQYDSVVTGKRQTLKFGIWGTDVTYLQQRLTAKGYGVGSIDGIFGAKTLEAVKAFQAENNLVVDGIVGNKTWYALC
ncbi:glucosaminidase domain-containing protein [Phocaeicola sartorii]|uniref:glucosaminidase domain-containing protein n=1 Tax=Phocaeicola sartorii TaxID=671267 RepID=UPI00272CBDFD|nr:glucosaminidase domain-containing protein [Phocaeicola sartorii]